MEEFDADAMRRAINQNRKNLGLPPQDISLQRNSLPFPHSPCPNSQAMAERFWDEIDALKRANTALGKRLHRIETNGEGA